MAEEQNVYIEPPSETIMRKYYRNLHRVQKANMEYRQKLMKKGRLDYKRYIG